MRRDGVADRADLNSPRDSAHAPKDGRNGAMRGAPSSTEKAAKPGLHGANPIRTPGIKQRSVTGGQKRDKPARVVVTGGFNTDKWS